MAAHRRESLGARDSGTAIKKYERALGRFTTLINSPCLQPWEAVLLPVLMAAPAGFPLSAGFCL